MPQIRDLRCNVAGLLGLRSNVQGLILVGDWWFKGEGWRGGLWKNKVLIKAGSAEFVIPGWRVEGGEWRVENGGWRMEWMKMQSRRLNSLGVDA